MLNHPMIHTIASGFPLLLLATAAPAVVLVQEGQPRAALVLPAEPHADEELAAGELQEHLERMSGAMLPVGSAAPEGAMPIRIGLALTPDAEALLRARGDDPAGFLLRVTPEGVSLAGLSPEGTLFAAYELLEQLGCRWFMPGEIGRVIPERPTVELREQETVQFPSFRHRHLQAVDQQLPWYRRVRLGGLYFPSCHGLPVGADFAKEPELFALVGGQRRPSQWCTSSPEVVRRVIEATKEYFRQNPDSPWLGMGPNDGGGFCECENCRALDTGDWDPFANEISVTDRYVHLFNAVLAEVHQEFPGKKLCFYAYHTYMRPPRREKPDPGITPAFAPITLCRIHGMNNPVCPDRSYYRQIMDGWGKLVPEIFERGYYFNLACPGFPFSKVHALRDETPYAKRAGITGWRVECLPAWGSHTPTLYVAAKLFWDADCDVDALLTDFYQSFFGPAAEPMGRYFTRMDAALRDGDHHAGCSYALPLLYPPPLRDASRADLEEAARLAAVGQSVRLPPAGRQTNSLRYAGGRTNSLRYAGETVYGQRVAMFRLTFDALEEFLTMLDRRNAFDFVAAQAALDRLRALQEQAVAHDPPLLNPRAAGSYLQRFWSQATEQGHERTIGGSRAAAETAALQNGAAAETAALQNNEFVAGLPDRWAFLLDPFQVGEDLGYHRPRLYGGNWQSLATVSATWSDQGLHYYKGDAWYRAAVEVPARFAGRKILLWFGGVDERAKVWVNGELLGESDGRAFVPFEFDATAAVHCGQANEVVVRVTNNSLDEIGTGGITAPVMFWSPGKG